MPPPKKTLLCSKNNVSPMHLECPTHIPPLEEFGKSPLKSSLICRPDEEARLRRTAWQEVLTRLVIVLNCHFLLVTTKNNVPPTF